MLKPSKPISKPNVHIDVNSLFVINPRKDGDLPEPCLSRFNPNFKCTNWRDMLTNILPINLMT